MTGNGKIDLFDQFSLDLARGCLVQAGMPVHLRPLAYEVLKYLVENRDHLISKNELIESVWRGRAVTDGVLVKCIEEVRDALGPDAREHIRNVRGRGYIFETGVSEQKSGAAIGVRSDQIDVVRVLVHEEETNTRTTATSNLIFLVPDSIIRSKAILVATIAVIIAAGIGIYKFGRRQLRASGASAPFREMSISQVTTSGNTTHAAISPDGKYVAHIIVDAEGDSLWLRQVDAPSSVRIVGPAATEFISVTFAPDGKSIYYVSLDRDKGDTALYRAPLLGGPSSAVINDPGPIALSSIDGRIAFIASDRTESHLVVANSDGTNRRILAFRKQPEILGGNWNAPAWSPDGKTIACQVRLSDERGQYETVIALSVENGSQQSLTSERFYSVGQPAWLADRSGLLVTAAENASSPMQLWHISLKSGETTRITKDLNNYYDLSLTSDTNKLSLVQVHAVSGIWVATDRDPNHPKQITSDAGWSEEMAWTPDGRIVYRSNAGGNADIWVMNADGSNAKQLTTGARASRGLAFSQDGRYIFFASDRAGRFNIWRVDADGGSLKQLTSGDDEVYPHCSPDGRWIVYQRGVMEPRLWKVPAEGGEPVQLTNTRAVRPAVSPDGELIAYHYLDPDFAKSRWSIGIVSANGGQRLKRFDLPPTVMPAQRFVRWFPDGRTIAFSNSPGGTSDIWLQPLDGSPARQLTDFKTEHILTFDWSPDGHTVAFIRALETKDVVLIDQAKQ